MATYKEIKGTQIELVATDPSNPVTGQVWYNTTSNVLKGLRPLLQGAWTTVNSMNTARIKSGSAGQTQDANLSAGGEPGVKNNTETWDGTSWTEVNNLNTARFGMGGAGTSTAALVFGGEGTPPKTAKTESWNGTNWTEVNDLNTVRVYLGSSGVTNTASLAFAGEGPTAVTELWNGTNWTEVNDLNNAQKYRSGGGSSTSALCWGGDGPPHAVFWNTESWNGTNWTELGDILQVASASSPAAGQDNTAILSMAGSSGTPSKATQFFNGSVWSMKANVNTGRSDVGGGGTVTAGLLYGGPSGQTEAFSQTSLAGSWATGGDMNIARQTLGSAQYGTSTASLGFGGQGPPPAAVAITESYNGTNWTEVNDLNTARRHMSGFGTYTSAIANGGWNGPPAYYGNTELWNGTNWTEVNDLNTARRYLANSGVDNTSGLAFGGYVGPPEDTAVTELWNGTNWTEVNDMNQKRNNLAGAGTATSALAMDGFLNAGGSNTFRQEVESWNGTNWTETTDTNQKKWGLAAGGTDNTNALAFGGAIDIPTLGQYQSNSVEEWNGSSWSFNSAMNTGRYGLAGSGASNTNCLAFGGYGTTYTAATEEWSGSGTATVTFTDS